MRHAIASAVKRSAIGGGMTSDPGLIDEPPDQRMQLQARGSQPRNQRGSGRLSYSTQGPAPALRI